MVLVPQRYQRLHPHTPPLLGRPNPPEHLRLHVTEGTLVEPVNDRGTVPPDVTEFFGPSTWLRAGVVVVRAMECAERVA